MSTLTPTLWREKSATVEAMQWDGSWESQVAIVNWASKGRNWFPVTGWIDTAYYLAVDTIHGEMRADPNDWITRTPRGEFYPCSPTLFQLIYEPDSN